MQFTVYNTSTGAVLRTGFTGSEEDCLAQAGPGEDVYLGPARFDQRIVDGAPVDAEDLMLAMQKQAISSQLEATRRARTAEPITLDGVKLDSDATAQSNIKDKLTELAYRLGQGHGMPAELLIWRDYDNGMHTFPDMVAYQAWLALVLIAIAERGTRTYLWMWEKKAQLDACTTLSELQALDLS